MEFEAALRTLVARGVGLRGCALLDQDGIVLASAAADPAESREDLGAHCALFLRELASIVPRLEGGPLRATILDAERGSVVLILLQGKYGLALHLDRDGNLGQALFEARKVGFALNAALA